MLKSQNIICISSIDWDFNWQGHQEIMSAFAKNGNRVLFIENTGVRVPNLRDIRRLNRRVIRWLRSTKGFRQETENLYIYSPIILPFPYSNIARWINRFLLIRPLRRWMKAVEFHSPIIWSFLPTEIALDITDCIDDRKLLVYYCIADFYELVANPKKVIRSENKLIKKSDVIFVQGEALAEKCRKLNNNVYIFPFGVNMEAFDNFQQTPHKVSGDIKDIKKPIIGYIGGIHRHTDFQLIRFIAQRHPEWSIVLIGPQQIGTSEIENLHNVFLLGKKDFSSLPDYINEFNVGIIPYKISEYTVTVFPTKLNEYHAMGKCVVSTDLPEVTKFNMKNNNLVLLAKTYEEFSDCICQALSRGGDEARRERIASARLNSWAARIGEMSGLLEVALKKKAKGPLQWQEIFLKFYKLWRKRVVTLSTVALSAYLLVFYTPIIWLMASPLKISQAPQKADCIVVFAGGVGESGKAGQGYEERVAHTVKLYKEGYARNIIFSSGYKFIFYETEVMKSLSIDMGIPKESIILEENAGTTYENVKFVKEILDKRKWKKALLVSSPYHMGRVSLVAKKIAPEIDFIYTPSNSSFYNYNASRKKITPGRISLKQINGILHEYLGIAYYWIKGYI